MIEFYMQFISPSSCSRARISVHLHARGAGELDTKIIEILLQVELEDVPAEKRQSIDLLEKHLEDEVKLSKDKVESIMSLAKKSGLKRTVSDTQAGDVASTSSAVSLATEITDIRRFKAGLLVSLGAHPVKDFSEFEETDAKL